MTPCAPRLDLYAPIHKALRHFMMDTLLRVGQLDVFDADDMTRTLGQLAALLTQCESHLDHENEFVHTAIEARLPTGSKRIAAEHVEHLMHIAMLRDEASALQAAGDGERMPLALRLYHHLALFVADNFQHMHIEETVHNPTLWAHYSDAELAEIHQRILATVPPQENLDTARWMLPALNPTESAGMLKAAQAELPRGPFLGIIEHVAPGPGPLGQGVARHRRGAGQRDMNHTPQFRRTR